MKLIKWINNDVEILLIIIKDGPGQIFVTPKWQVLSMVFELTRLAKIEGLLIYAVNC